MAKDVVMGRGYMATDVVMGGGYMLEYQPESSL